MAEYINHLNTAMLINVGIAFLIFMFFALMGRQLSNRVLTLVFKVTVRTKTKLDEHLVEAFRKPIRWIFLLLGLYIALKVVNIQITANISTVFRTAVIILVTWGICNLFDQPDFFHVDLSNILKADLDITLVKFFSRVMKAVVVLLALTVVLQEWDYDISSLIAGLGLGGLGFALAAKDVAANIFGGIVIITEKPFVIGDWIMTPSVDGTVEDISFRSTRVRTFAQSLVTVPNSTLANEPITNWSKMGKRRITFNLGVTYSTPEEKIRACIEDIRLMLNEHPSIDKETIFVTFDNYNDSSLDIFLYFFAVSVDWGEFLMIKEDVNYRIMHILEKHGVSVAFPSHSLYIEQQ